MWFPPVSGFSPRQAVVKQIKDENISLCQYFCARRVPLSSQYAVVAWVCGSKQLAAAKRRHRLAAVPAGPCYYYRPWRT
jgi:hypothetical protein